VHADSCWAFAAVGVVEGLHKIQVGQLTTLSSQQVLDCSPKAGANTRLVFEWIHPNRGVASEVAYPCMARRY
jgi:hypothetical protein